MARITPKLSNILEINSNGHVSACFETQTLQNKIPFDPQNTIQQERVNCKHATAVKPPAKHYQQETQHHMTHKCL